ncbi:hypothetical protein ACFOZY_08615 [Chungangia koreensis]|uniref:Uncharacterized protein n=1 Tax=Chungangia koreensis TaxID=752657 RepID=A0ABV8X696_9LACT
MFKRKVCAAIAASIIAPLLCVFWLMIFEGESMTGSFGAYFFYAMYAVPLVWVYGLPVSCLSDFIVKKLEGAGRMCVALLIHVLFGFGFTFIFTLLLEPDLFKSEHFFSGISFFFIWSATLSSLVFWAVDEYNRCRITGEWVICKRSLA